MNKNDPLTIGVIGGVGPYAGLDLMEKIFAQTKADRDQEHLPVLLVSKPALISDRTAHLLHPEESPNPGATLGRLGVSLGEAGARVIGIPCNTAHAPKILMECRKELPAELTFVHMIEETFAVLQDLRKQAAPPLQDKKNKEMTKMTKMTIGLLATAGTYASKVYEGVAAEAGFRILQPESHEREAVHAAIYDTTYGIKAVLPVTERARNVMEDIAQKLIERGAEAIIMGCTEIPLAMKNTSLSVPKMDPTEILARALIREAAPHKLKALA